MTDHRPAPYPADTSAKGWRFELDYERIEQSDTWALTTYRPDARPWLLMTWYAAWKQKPCGSLPADPGLFCAAIGAPPAVWSKHKDILLRGWWLADDGRMYHDTLTQRVLEMMQSRRKESDRKAAVRARKAGGVPPVSHGTNLGLHPESDTGTGTSTGRNTEPSEEIERAPPPGEGESELIDLTGHQPTPAGAACRAIRLAGIADANPSHPDLIRLLAAGITAQVLGDTAAELIGKGKASFAYLLKTVEGRRIDAAAKAAVPAAPPAPTVTVASDAAAKTSAYLAAQVPTAEERARSEAARIAALAKLPIRRREATEPQETPACQP